MYTDGEYAEGVCTDGVCMDDGAESDVHCDAGDAGEENGASVPSAARPPRVAADRVAAARRLQPSTTRKSHRQMRRRPQSVRAAKAASGIEE